MKKPAIIAFILLLAATIITRSTGFLREIVTGSALGTTNLSDAYLASVSIPNVLFMNIAGAISITFIPIYVQVRNQGGDKKSAEFTNNILNITLLVCVFLAVITVIFSKQIISLLFFGFDDTTLGITSDISKIIFLATIFLGANAIFSSYLESNNRFALNMLNAIAYNVIVIAALLSYNSLGLRGLAYATLAGTFAQTLYLSINAFIAGFRYKPVLNLRDKAVRDLFILTLPVFLSNSITQLSAMVDRTLASDLAQGSISALNYSNRLTIFVYSLTSLAIGTIIYPRLSEYSSSGSGVAFKNLISKSLNTVTVMLMPITFGACILSGPVIKLLFERGAFDSNSSAMTSSVLFYYSLGMVFVGYRDILNRAFYSLQDAKTPMICSVASIISNIILSLIFSRFMAHNGLALATSISAFISVCLLMFFMHKRLRKQQNDMGLAGASGIGLKRMIITFTKSLSSACIMGAAVFFSYNRLYTYFFDSLSERLIVGSVTITELFILISVVCIGLVVYGIFVLLLKTEEVWWVVGYLRSKLFKRNRG